MTYPFVSFIIPTLNAKKYLAACLESIHKQNYPQNKYEVLVIDGGSADGTVMIAKKFHARVLYNASRDAESGKSIGIQAAKGEIIALVDADNELVENDWLVRMVAPLLADSKIFGVESPWYVRKGDPLMNQYVTLLHIADPLARRLHPVMKEEDHVSYTVYHLKLGDTPVVGANGFLWRKKFIKTINQYKPKFEEVNYISLMVAHGFVVYARVKDVGIYHHYCTSVIDFIKKRIKIGRKFLTRKQKGQDTWVDQSRKSSFAAAVLYNISVVGPFFEAVREYKRSGNISWFLHPALSFITIIVYGCVFIEMFFKRLSNPAI
ncbi:glycosyltransferase family 2 protein [Candidatus Gottesmanbacteria bacterium]|nr:glycosyltransferase family 2 protein [Candidatus Gottesmanbacteria bacterium]